jgi:hypothetical protein
VLRVKPRAHGGGDDEPALLHLPLLENVGLGRDVQRHLRQHPILHAWDVEGQLDLGDHLIPSLARSL